MRICHLFIFLFLGLFSLNMAEERQVSGIFQIDSLGQISKDHPEQTLFLFDLDDTIFDFPHMLGSKAWRKYIAEATQEIDASVNWHDIFSYFITQNHPIVSVEEITSNFISNLQQHGHIVCGFTSRERNLWYDTSQPSVDLLTVNQLNSLNIDFDKGELEKRFPDLAKNSEYFQGIFFANIEPKGNFLWHLLNNTALLPQKIVFIDDKPSQVESVSATLDQLGIANECYIYTATNQKAKRFDPLIANIELYYFYLSDGKETLSDQEALQIAQENPDKDAPYYLKAAMEMALQRTINGVCSTSNLINH